MSDYPNRNQRSPFSRFREIRVDCEQAALLLNVEQTAKGVCHTGRASCFYRGLRKPAGRLLLLTPRDAEKVFDPSEVYGVSGKAG